MPQTSVIIPTRNRSSSLTRAIESAMHAGEDIEIIVVDNASDDPTPSICGSLPFIRYLRLDQNLGPVGARNIGIQESTGEFLAFLDDDDLRISGTIGKQAEILSADKHLGFVYGQVHIGDPETCIPTGEIRPKHCPIGDIFWELIKGNFIYLPSILVSKRHVRMIGGFDPKLTGTEDWDLLLRLSAISAVAALPEPVGVYRDFTPKSGQISSNRVAMCRSGARTQAKALRSARAQAANFRTRRAVRSEHMAHAWTDLITQGHRLMSEGEVFNAAANYLAAVQLSPARAIRFFSRMFRKNYLFKFR